MGDVAASRVGRVGALALALGVGAAVFALPGLAAADADGSDGARGTTARSESHSTQRATTQARGGAQRAAGARQRGRTAGQKIPTAGAVVPVGDSTAASARPRPARTTPPPSSAPSSAPSAGNAGATASVARSALGPLASTPVAQTSTRTLAPVVQKIDAQTQAAVRTVFRDLLNVLSTLPVNAVTSWLEGGLQVVRRSFFNQTAGVSSTQTANSPQLVTGKIDVIDPDGDGWNIEVVENPSHGTVVLGTPSQADGIGKVTYTYVPGEGYTGDDQFVVKVTPASPTVNILQPEPLRIRYYTVAVGDAAEAAADRFNAEGDAPKDTLDTHLYLSNAAATVTVKKQGLFNPTYTTTLTLPAATAAKSFAWMDTRGNMGTIAVDTMLVDDWEAYTKKAAENGVQPLVTFKYSDQGVEKAVVLDVDKLTKNGDGSYTITGVLKDGVAAQEGRVDTWDFMGNRYRTAFNNFLNTPGVKDCKSGQECTTVSAVGILGATTLSPSAFTETGGHDYLLPQPGDASALQTSPGSMGPGTTGVGAGNGTAVFGNTGYQELELTSMIPWGNDGSFIAATNLSLAENAAEGSGIFLYSAQTPNGGAPTWTKTQLADNSWNAAVNVMAAYDQVLTDSHGTPIRTAYTGTSVSSTGAVNALKLAVPGDVDPSSLIGQTIAGDGIAANTVITGFISSDITGVTYSVDNPIDISRPIAVTFPDQPPTQQPGLVVGLSDGSVYYWNGTTCTKVTCVGPVVNGAEGVVMQTENGPVSIAIAPNGTAYSAGLSFTLIDTAKNEIIGSLPIYWNQGQTFPSVVVSPDGFYAYSTTSLSGNTSGIAVIDTAKNAITSTIELPVNATANAVAISPDSMYGYVSNNALIGGVPPSVYQFNATNNTLGPNIVLPEGSNPWGLAFSADGSQLYVSDAANGIVRIIDTATNTLLPQTIDVGPNPGTLAVSPDGQYLWVTQTPNNGNSIAVIDTSTNTVSQVIPMGSGPSGIAFNPNPGLPYAYVSNSNDSTVWVIDTRTAEVIGSFATGAGGDDTLGIAVTHDGLNIYLANYDGGGDSYGTVPVYQVATAVEKGWTQLQAGNGWGDGVAVNSIVALPNNNGFVVGLSDGTVATWNNPILGDGTIMTAPGVSAGCSNGTPGSCWTVLPDNNLTTVNAIVPSGQTGGFVAIGANGGTGWAQGFNGSVTFGGPGVGFGGEIPTTVIPYDGTTLVGSIGSAPVIVESGVISAPSYASALPDLSASSAGCSGSYSSGSGAGCAGYVLTVQQAAGQPIRVGQTLYGGAGLLPGTVITQQISDGDGNLCTVSCTVGGAGVYLVNTSQAIAPGTPMSASDGSGFMIGTNDGSVFGWNNDIAVLTPADTWYSAENTMIPWRDGFVVGLDNGAIMYWSPSNTPAGGTPYVPLNGISMALDYPDATVTVPGQPTQPPGWSQLQGWTQECGCLGWDGQAVTSMVQMGDGFAVGLTSPDDSSNGAVMMFTGYGPGSATSAFGYLQATNTSGQTTLQALTPSNSWSQIAGTSTLPVANGTPGSVQQMIPINQFTKDSAGNWWNTSSLVVGLTDNGIYSWDGSNLTPSDTAWNQQQAPAPLPGQLDATTLQGAWDFATGATAPTGAFGNSKAVGGSDDPIFSQVFNQAACGSISDCNSQGDYQTFALNYPLGDNGVIYSYGTDLQADLNMTAAGYGYLFVPNGILDKFEPDQYSAGLVLGLLVGPSVTLNIQNGGSVKETLKAHYDYTDMQDTEVGVFGETVGVDASLTGVLSVNPSVPSPLPLAWAYYIPGLQFTWNTNGNPDSMGMSYSAFSDTGYVTADQLEAFFDPTVKATITATVTPYATVSYGLFTTSPIDLSIFKLSLGFQNPITAELTVPLNNHSDTALSVSSQGFLTADAAFIPQITSDLTWKGKYQLYSVKDQL